MCFTQHSAAQRTSSTRRFGSGLMTVRPLKSTRFPLRLPRKRPCLPLSRCTNPLRLPRGQRWRQGRWRRRCGTPSAACAACCEELARCAATAPGTGTRYAAQPSTTQQITAAQRQRSAHLMGLPGMWYMVDRPGRSELMYIAAWICSTESKARKARGEVSGRAAAVRASERVLNVLNETDGLQRLNAQASQPAALSDRRCATQQRASRGPSLALPSDLPLSPSPLSSAQQCPRPTLPPAPLAAPPYSTHLQEVPVLHQVGDGQTLLQALPQHRVHLSNLRARAAAGVRVWVGGCVCVCVCERGGWVRSGGNACQWGARATTRRGGAASCCPAAATVSPA